MHRTPWTKQASSLPSDRIKPKIQNNPTSRNKGKGRLQDSPEPPRSKEVKRLESLLKGVNESSGTEKDPTGGCFCLARNHALSSYITICHSCGLILCSTNLPYHCCPHCSKILLTSTVRDKLVAQIDAQLSSTIAKEIADKERAIEEARRLAGAFPTLQGPVPAQPPASMSLSVHQAAFPVPAQQTHKVMSLTSSGPGNKKQIKVSSFTTSPVPSRPISRNEPKEDEDEFAGTRVPAPDGLPPHANRRPSQGRPWENLIKGGITYKPPARVDEGGTGEGGLKSSRRRRGNKGKGKENEASAGTSIGKIDQ
ncbi:unnamed protein product [Cyclocybe aegerita]|uniref:TRIP4/RQT4 C2HC5-type zinc finger domain-containing protein n=1 Tax=Cyclocybe aegerita TaxID=1973307 RepID=A0A8S0WHU7_CYCAE|nr:unnamed protein product [Cyclocybe aegerita]